MIHRHRRVEHDHLNSEPGHRHYGGENYWAPPGVSPSGQRDEGEYHFIPGEILVHDAEYDRPEVRESLTRFEFMPPDRAWALKAAPRQTPDPVVRGMLRVTMDAPPDSFHRLEVPLIVDNIRRSRPDVPGTQIAPNHVFFGSWHATWGPAHPVQLADAPFKRFPKKGPGRGVTIAVLDTGAVKHRLLPTKPDKQTHDLPDEDGDQTLDYEAGHGVFIEGIIKRFAPGATVVHKRVLTSNGTVDDASLAAQLHEVGNADIINLSLGGYTHDNRGPYALPRVLEDLRQAKPELVVVAAAGNDHTDRPFYPGAAKGVIAVAAHEEADQNARAAYSNFGWWVDARAQGTHVSTFYEPKYGGEDGSLVTPEGRPLSDSSGWARWSGTSFAAPVVAAAIAARMTDDGLDARAASRALLDEGIGSHREGIGVLVDPKDHTG